MHLPTLRQLQFLCALADERSFSRAADACNVTQPTLSSAIKEIEALLGVQLVEREARGASLTLAGEEAVQRARAILSGAADLVASAQQAGAPLSGPFHLGAIPTLAPYLLPRTVADLRSAHPELKLYLREDQTDRLLDGLRSRQLDAALIALPPEMRKSYVNHLTAIIPDDTRILLITLDLLDCLDSLRHRHAQQANPLAIGKAPDPLRVLLHHIHQDIVIRGIE